MGGSEHEITAVEWDKDIAKVYSSFFPQDKMMIDDAHDYLLKHYKEYDFIWSSPPCPTHSTFAKLRAKSDDYKRGNHKYNAKYPDMMLYQEVLLLQHFFDGKWVVENVIPYYEPLIPAQKIQRHLFWANFIISDIKIPSDNIKNGKRKEWEDRLGFDLSPFKLKMRTDTILRNCVNPELGLHILNEALEVKTPSAVPLFS